MVQIEHILINFRRWEERDVQVDRYFDEPLRGHNGRDTDVINHRCDRTRFLVTVSVGCMGGDAVGSESTEP